MEATKEDIGFLNKIRPPRLEDAGLEDCALPPDAIKEAFLKAATAVSSRFASVLTSGDESDGECVNDPLPGEISDAIVGSELSGNAPGLCIAEKGGPLTGNGDLGADLVGSGTLEGKEDVIIAPPEEEKDEQPCVEGTKGLKIREKKDDKVEEGEGPTLVEGYLV